MIPIIPFGEALLRTGDLDPLYIALVRARPTVGRRWLHRFLVAYWCLYDVGGACYIADADSLDEAWARLRRAAVNETPSPIGGRWRRASERRHWRGENALNSFIHLRSRHSYLNGMTTALQVATSYTDVVQRVRTYKGFGPWIAFKAADMMERVVGTPLCIEDAAKFFAPAPIAGAVRAWQVHRSYFLPAHPSECSEQDKVSWAIEHLRDALGEMEAPNGGRLVGLPEIETVLCKWKSHCNGRYQVGHDTKEIRHHLEPWIAISDGARALWDNYFAEQ